jgi:F0F1-type ATP synthase alpha subunit
VVDKITDNIFENFEPIESKLEAKEDMEIKIGNYLKESFEQIFKKVYKYCHCFEKMFIFAKSMLTQDKIKTELIIRNNHHILEVFQVYKKLLKQIDFKWKNKKKKETHYKKMNELFTSESKSIPNKKRKRNNKFWSFDKDLTALLLFILKES